MHQEVVKSLDIIIFWFVFAVSPSFFLGGALFWFVVVVDYVAECRKDE